VSSAGVAWGFQEGSFADRMAHEAAWEKRLRANARTGLAASVPVRDSCWDATSKLQRNITFRGLYVECIET
jgi:hypothetical protein